MASSLRRVQRSILTLGGVSCFLAGSFGLDAKAQCVTYVCARALAMLVLLSSKNAAKLGEVANAAGPMPGLVFPPKHSHFCRDSAKAPKSLVVWSSFPHGQTGAEPENVVFVILGLPKRKSGPYNPPIAEERGAKRRRARRQASEIKSIFGFRISSFGF
ncbi:hypothetical protein [Devosia sp. XK-2]|uniref:hypothetical protein n=1 Tax=Devosia sp. XK-2 TaxID=3126689 RepID=UPI0030D4FB1B